MKRATVTIPDDIDLALDAYLGEQEVEQPLTAVVQAALREFLTMRGYLPRMPKKALNIRPFPKGSGHSDVSINHDTHLAEGWFKRRG